jgi:hypothetical protein
MSWQTAMPLGFMPLYIAISSVGSSKVVSSD